MLDTFMFDLDGTLLPIDMNEFEKTYFGEMGNFFCDIIEPKKLVECVWIAAKAMVDNLENRSNEEVFMDEFSKLIDGDINVYKERFDRFYDESFLKLKELVADVPIMRESIKILKEKGYNLVIATNPIFPLKSILHRIRWAGFEPEQFSYISCYENNRYCKPQIQFYEEVLENIGKRPEQCIMVGNDVQEDLVAGKLGMDTFLIEDYMLHRTDDEIKATYKGSYQDFFNFVMNLAPVR